MHGKGARRQRGSPFLARRALLLAASGLLFARPALAALLRTPPATEGPFYPTPLPTDRDNDLVRVEGAVRQAGGDILHLHGRLLDQDARLVAGARIEIWQCDANGIYLHPRERRLARRDSGFQGFGQALTDGDGRFAFRTIVPVPYTGRTPHIHCKVFRDRREVLTTQLYRAGYPQNASNFLFRRLSAAEQERVSMTLAPHADGFETAVDIILAS